MSQEAHRRWESLSDALRRLAMLDPQLRTWIHAYKDQLLTKTDLDDKIINYLLK